MGAKAAIDLRDGNAESSLKEPRRSALSFQILACMGDFLQWLKNCVSTSAIALGMSKARAYERA